MTNKEAAEFIWGVLDGTKSFNEKGGRGLEALELAIKALKNEKTKESEIIKAYTKGFDTGVETVKNETDIPNGWKTEIVEIRKCYATCPYCEFSFEMQRNRELPYFCGACGRRLRGDNNGSN